MILSIFSYNSWTFVCTLWKNVCSNPLPIFNIKLPVGLFSFFCVLLSYKRFFFFFKVCWIITFYPIYSLQFFFFFYSVGCLFTLSIVYFPVQKISCLILSHLSIFPSIACVFRVIFKKPLLTLMS